MPNDIIPFEGRTIERGRGCWNCKSWDSGDLVKAHWKARRAAEIRAAGFDLTIRGRAALPDDALIQAATLAACPGWTPDKAAEHVIAGGALGRETARKTAFDVMVDAGLIGICRAGKSPGDFCENAYLCDNWSGVQGSSLATSGHALDKLPEELYDDRGEKPPEKP